MKISLAVVPLVLAACGSDALIGTWKSAPNAFVDAHGDTGMATEMLTFKADLSFTTTDDVVYDASSDLAGCTDTGSASGTYSESNTAGQLGIAETFIAGTFQSTGCTNAASNVPSQAIAASDLAADNGSYNYAIKGKTLTLNRSIAGQLGPAIVYTKQ